MIAILNEQPNQTSRLPLLKIGGFLYNFFHHKLVAILIFALGLLLKNEVLIFIGIILFAHSSMDRIFGYGLKYPDDFKHTHLGWIGKE